MTMISPLDHIGRCERAFGADQQEKRHWPQFEFVLTIEDHELEASHMVVARGDYYGWATASWCDGHGYYVVSVREWFVDFEMKKSLTEAAKFDPLAWAIVASLNMWAVSKAGDEKIATACADAEEALR